MYTNNETESAIDVNMNRYKNIYRAMIERAIYDLKSEDGKLASSAHAWLIDYDNVLECGLSVSMCCEALNMNYDDLMERLYKSRILTDNVDIDQFIIAS